MSANTSVSPIGTKCDHFMLLNQIVASYLGKSKQPIMIHGGPGLGKSDIVREAALRLAKITGDENFDVIDIRLLLLEPSDLRGLPFITSENECEWAIAPFLPKDPDSKGILFLDELASASQQLMKAAYQLVLDREIGEYRLPDGWLVIGAGNRLSDRGGVNVMPTPLKNRFIHCELDETSIVGSWKDYAFNAGVHDAVIAYISFRPDALYQFNIQNNAFPTPRSWGFVSNALYELESFTPALTTAHMNDDIDSLRESILAARIQGTIGSGICDEFAAFLRVRDKLPRKEVILSGAAYQLDYNKTDIIWAVNTMLVSHFLTKNKEKKAQKPTEVFAALEFIEKIPKADLKAAALRELNIQGRLNLYMNHGTTPENVKKKFMSIFNSIKQYM